MCAHDRGAAGVEHRTLNRFTGLCAGILVATYITLEAPLSGMSMNPARTFGSAVSAQLWTALWIYFVAPPLGMLLAAELSVRRHGAQSVLCAKLHHHNTRRCIFHCRYAEAWPGGVSRQPASPVADQVRPPPAHQAHRCCQARRLGPQQTPARQPRADATSPEVDLHDARDRA